MEPQQIEAILGQLSLYLVLLFSLSVHESAHAWSALRMGDDTAARQGRISLNPLVHIDPLGTVLFPLLLLFSGSGFLFGWAKPTPVQPRYFKRYRLGQVLTAGAGPASNFLLAVVFTALYAVALATLGWGHPAARLAWMGVWLNVILGVFNLIPVPPLDGSWVLSWGLPRRWGDLYDRFVAPYGTILLIVLFVSGGLGLVMDVVAGPIVDALGRLASAAARG